MKRIFYFTLFILLATSCHSLIGFKRSVRSSDVIINEQLKMAIINAEEQAPSRMKYPYIIRVVFMEKDGINVVYIDMNTDDYRIKDTEGWERHGKYLIVYYNYLGDLFYEFIDTSELSDKIPKGFDNEFSEYSSGALLEPWGWRYKITESDSLELVHKGFL